MLTLERRAHDIMPAKETKMTALKELEPERFIYEPDPHPPQNYGERDDGLPRFRLAPPTATGRKWRAARRWARKHGYNAAIVTLLLASAALALAALLDWH